MKNDIPITKSVMVLEDTDDFVCWRIPCGCQDNKHNWTFEIEYDKKVNDIVMCVSCNLHTKFYSFHHNWFLDKLHDLSNRVKIALRVLFLGYVEYEMDIPFQGSDKIRDHILTLTKALEKIETSDRKYGYFEPGHLKNLKRSNDSMAGNSSC